RTTCAPVGTPPRRRGGRAAPVHDVAGDRNTPASAGRTTTGRPARPRSSEHPRVGGEDVSNLVGSASSSGTPPRRRGGRDDLSGEPRRLRNTPASAGRTTAPPPRTSPTAEHPRVGGEDSSRAWLRAPAFGTPPRRRGGRGQPGRAARPARNTPASAGAKACMPVFSGVRRPRPTRNTGAHGASPRLLPRGPSRSGGAAMHEPDSGIASLVGT